MKYWAGYRGSWGLLGQGILKHALNRATSRLARPS